MTVSANTFPNLPYYMTGQNGVLFVGLIDTLHAEAKKEIASVHAI